MRKTLTALSLVVASTLGLAAPATWAAGFGHQQDLTVDGQQLKVTETSARVLGDATGKLAVVEDITDGLGAKKVPGFKMMVMSRASSVAFDGRQNDDGTWRDNRYIHRGSKITFGVPMVDGKPDLANAVLLSFAVIADKPEAAQFKAEDKIRPRGQQLLKKDTKVGASSLKVTALELPDMASGERNGGGIKLTATVELNGKKAEAVVDSTFQHFDVAKPDSRSFAADARFVKP